MTENEAKEWIKYLGNRNLPYDRSPKSRKLACDIAIQALEEIQQYRAIGTVEEIQSMKDNGAFSGIELAQLAAMQMRLKDYQAIGTIEEFKAFKECIDCSATVKWTNKNRIEVNGEQFTRVTPIEEDIDWQ